MQTQCKANDKRIATEAATKADADLKKAEVDKKKTGVTLGDLKNVYDVVDFEVKTGAKDAEVKRGDMSIKSAWDKGSGVDALTTYMLWWKLTPTADYEFGKSRIQLVTAECEWCTGFEVSQFTNRLSGDGQTTQQIYNYNSFDTVYGIQSNRISSSQKTTVELNRFLFTLNAEGEFAANESMKDAKFWKLSAANCAFDAKDGAQTVTMMKTNAGLQKIKAGGAIYGDVIYTDATGRIETGAYIGFANDPADVDDNDGGDGGEDSAFAMTATAALAVAAAALF